MEAAAVPVEAVDHEGGGGVPGGPLDISQVPGRAGGGELRLDDFRARQEEHLSIGDGGKKSAQKANCQHTRAGTGSGSAAGARDSTNLC